MARPASLSYRFSCLLFFLIFFSFALLGCSNNESPEDHVRQYVASAVTAVESRDALAVRKFISEHYMDDGRRDRRALVALTMGYFLRHKNIHLFTQISEIKFPVPDKARVQLYAAMTGSPATGAQPLLDIRADLYQFDLMLRKESGEWLLQKARWQRTSIDDFLSAE